MSCKEWKEYTIEELCRVIDSLHKSPKYVESGYPIIRVKDMTQGFLKFESPAYVTKEVYEEFSKKHKPRKGDMLFSRVGSYGITTFVDKDAEFCLGQNTVVITDFNRKLIDNKFMYYMMISDIVKEQVEMLVTGSTQKTISMKSIKSIAIPTPSLEEQEKIANILSSLDNKIELNNEMSKTLEEMAKSIFKRWFVDFEFPNDDGEPYKSSGGEMVDSELGMIPKGWEVKELGDAVEFKYGKMPKKTEIVDEGYPIFSGYKITGYYKNFMFEEPQLIVVARGVGGTGDVKFSPPKCYLTNLSIAILLSNNYKIREYLYYYLKKSNLKMLDTGSAQSQITIANLSKFKIVNPSNEIIEKFHTFICSIFKSKDDISLENEQLTSIRDTLLPKLMSGEIRLK